MPITRQIQATCANVECEMRDITMAAKWEGTPRTAQLSAVPEAVEGHAVR